MKNLSKLRSQGHRITKQREKILEALSATPQSVGVIYKKLNNKVNLVSVYRNLELLSKIDIIRVLDFGDGKKRYELIDEGRHHHHLICNHCGSTEDVAINEIDFLKNLKTTG